MTIEAGACSQIFGFLCYSQEPPVGGVTCLECVSASWRNLHCHYLFAGHHHHKQLPKQPCQVKPPTSCFTHAKAARQAGKLPVEKVVGIP